jgi:hypothetical protein
LDRSGSFVTSRSNGGNDFFGQAESGKRHKPSKRPRQLLLRLS